MTGKEIRVQEEKAVSASDYRAAAVDWLKGMGLRLPQKYANQFIDICAAYGLNPIKREIYAVGYGENWNIITGYEVYLKRAERTGKLDGWECHIEGSGENMSAKLTVYRKDWKMPFVHEVYWDEAVQRKKDGTINSMWAKMGRFMLKKVAIAQGFRLCFPDELGGMPYTSDEIPEDEVQSGIPAGPDAYEPAGNVIAPDSGGQECAVTLEALVSEYGRELAGKPLELARECLEKGGDAKAMLERVRTYLGRKGIRV